MSLPRYMPSGEHLAIRIGKGRHYAIPTYQEDSSRSWLIGNDKKTYGSIDRNIFRFRDQVLCVLIGVDPMG